MKSWKIIFGFVIIFSTLIIGTSVRQAFISRFEGDNQGVTAGLIPYRSIAVNLQAQDETLKTLLVEYNSDFEIKANFEKIKKVDLLFSPDSKNLIFKGFSKDSNFNKSYNYQMVLNTDSKEIVQESQDLNTDYFFDSDNKVVDIRKILIDEMNSGLTFEKNGNKKTVNNPSDDNGVMWQIASDALYLSKKEFLIIHYFNPVQVNGKNLINVFDLNQNKNIYSFETLPFSTLRYDESQDLIYTVDDSRYDTEFFDLQDGSRHTLNNLNYILASDVLNNESNYSFITGGKSEISSKDRYMPIGENSDQLIKIWDIESQNLVESIPVSNNNLTDIITTSNLRTLITGNSSGSINFIDLVTKKIYFSLEPNLETAIPSNDSLPFKISVSNDERSLVAFNKDGRLYFWRLNLKNTN